MIATASSRKPARGADAAGGAFLPSLDSPRSWEGRMMFRLAAFASLSLTAVALAQEPAPKEKLYKTPQAVYDAAMAAHKRKDYKTAIACFAPEAQKDTAAAMALNALNVKAGNNEEIRKTFKPLFDVLDKHGLTEKAVKDVDLGEDPRTVEKSREKLKKLIKKPAEFAVDYLKAQDKLGAGDRPGETKSKLTDVKINGDKATGTVRIDFGGDREITQPVEFVKINGSWKLIPEPKQKAK
jgi:hypothetical protein